MNKETWDKLKRGNKQLQQLKKNMKKGLFGTAIPSKENTSTMDTNGNEKSEDMSMSGGNDLP